VQDGVQNFMSREARIEYGFSLFHLADDDVNRVGFECQHIVVDQ